MIRLRLILPRRILQAYFQISGDSVLVRCQGGELLFTDVAEPGQNLPADFLLIFENADRPELQLPPFILKKRYRAVANFVVILKGEDQQGASNAINPAIHRIFSLWVMPLIMPIKGKTFCRNMLGDKGAKILQES